MTEEEFRNNLTNATNALYKLASSLTKNRLSNNYVFKLTANSTEESHHLNEFELTKLKEINCLNNRLFDLNETSSILSSNGLVPLWINMEITNSTKSKTVITLFCSRRYRHKKDLNFKVDQFAPLHPLVSLPPWQKESVKFNINWESQKWKRKLYAKYWFFINKKRNYNT